MATRLNAATCLPVVITAVLAACGGGTAATPGGPAATSAGQPTTAPAATQGQPAQTEPGQPPVGSTDDACALVTVAEWESVTNLGVAASAPIEMGPPNVGCIYTTADGGAGTINVSPNGGMWDMVWSASGLPEVDGVGEDAVFDENSAALVILVGDQILSVNAGTGADELDTRLEWAKALGQIAIGRM